MTIIPTTYPHLSKPLFCLLLWQVAVQAFAQSPPTLRLVPLGYIAGDAHTTLRQQAAGDTLTLPFWDDFSTTFTTDTIAPSFQPDTSLWTAGSRHVRINTGMAIQPPSIGVATFDGVDASGRGYNVNNLNRGLSDSLVSKPINLALVPVNERSQVFFSFFWQQKGNGELPDPEDSLRLQFKNDSSEWVTQWVRSGSEATPTDAFFQEIIAVVDASFFHSGFQFRFQSYNRQSGGFDTWNVDYIYLNKNRSEKNTAYLDRALTTPPSSLFKEYTAIPMKIFRENPAMYIGNSSVGFYNLNVQLQPVRFTALVNNKNTGQPIAVLNDQNALSPVPAGGDRRTITAAPLDVNTLDLNQDSLYLETEFYLTSGDRFLVSAINGADTVFSQQVDYRVNDTVRTTFVLDEHFAYDDGGAEYGIELNQQNGKLAYQFYTPKRALLTHIDVYFPSINQNAAGTPLKLFVWRSLENDTLNQGISSPASVQPNAVDQFYSFELTSPVFVQDTFYIGYEQVGDAIAVVGFDKNTNTGNKIFYNVRGEWQQNPDLQGSLMMRPRFDKDRVLTAVPGEAAVSEEPFYKIYPNPTEGELRIEGLHKEISVLDMYGKEVFHQVYASARTETQLDLSTLSRGVYVVRVYRQGKVYAYKIIKR